MHTSGRSETIEVFGAEDYAGICFLQDGKPSGVFPQILAGVSKYSGDTYQLSLFPWKRAQSYAEQGRGAIAHFSKTREREEKFDFSHRVYGDKVHLVVLKGKEFPFKNLQDLKGKRIGVKFGAAFGQAADAFLASDVVDVQRDPGLNSRLRKLLLNRIDVAVVEGAEGDIKRLVTHDDELKRDIDRFVLLPEPLVDDALYLAFAKVAHRKDALDRFNMGLAQFKKSDAYKKLLAR